MASPSTVITMGYGNGTLNGSPSLVLTLGYGVGAAVIRDSGEVTRALRRAIVVRAIKR